MNPVTDHLRQLRAAMRAADISACIIPGTDPHASEYIADHWKEREWASGFNGSAGTAVVTYNQAAVWTDSRYFLQGAEQLKDTGYSLMKMGLPDTPEITTWLSTVLKLGEKVAVNPQMFSMNAYATLQNELTMQGLQLIPADIISEAWKDRPALPAKPLFVFGPEHSGQSCSNKLKEVRKRMQSAHADVLILTALDDIAWLFNIRGNDVDFNPVVIAYATIETDKATLYIDAAKLTPETEKYFQAEGVTLNDYQAIYTDLRALIQKKKVMVDGAKLNQSLLEAIPAGCPKTVQMSPVFQLKSIKNEVELKGIKQAMIKDGVALTRFFRWLETQVKERRQTEYSINQMLYSFRKEQGDFFGESFGTIAGYGGNGAIVHYRADENNSAVIAPDNILLLDSGGQYLQGTTDITRTVTLGKPTAQQKKDFTLVLKGHIGIATAQFPSGTRGSQLDILARKAMWDIGINYGHGTGHGIGHFLNVHEGPQSIRMEENPVTLQPGMLLSNEPGIYRTGDYGIRIENLVLVIPGATTEFGNFLKFETLTLFPIDAHLIEEKMLTSAEKEWLKDYHQRVYAELSPLLDNDEREWLKQKTQLNFN